MREKEFLSITLEKGVRMETFVLGVAVGVLLTIALDLFRTYLLRRKVAKQTAQLDGWLVIDVEVVEKGTFRPIKHP